MPSFKDMMHLRVKKSIYSECRKGKGIHVWESVRQQVHLNHIHITALLWLVSLHHPAVATGFVP